MTCSNRRHGPRHSLASRANSTDGRACAAGRAARRLETRARVLAFSRSPGGPPAGYLPAGGGAIFFSQRRHSPFLEWRQPTESAHQHGSSSSPLPGLAVRICGVGTAALARAPRRGAAGGACRVHRVHRRKPSAWVGHTAGVSGLPEAAALPAWCSGASGWALSLQIRLRAAWGAGVGR